MAIQRYISTSFYDDTWIHRLDPSEKFMYMYLLTNGLTNIAGVYKIGIDRMVYDTGFNEHTVKHILEKFEKSGKAFYRFEYIVLPTWPKHQKWQEKPKIKTGIDTILSKTPREIITFLGTVKFCYDLTAFGGIAYDSLSLGTNYSDSDLDSDTDSDSDTNVGSGTRPKRARTRLPVVNDPLLKPIIDSFLTEGRFGDYAKETACAKKVVRVIRNLSPDDPESAARIILHTFRDLTHGSNDFWLKQPFLPSGLSPLIERVWAEATKVHRPQNLDWLHKIRSGQS